MNKDITFVLPKRLDCRSALALTSAMDCVFNSLQNGAWLHFDLMNVRYIDSAGIGFLQYTASFAQQHQFQIVLANMAPDLKGNLLDTHLTNALIVT